MDIASFRASVGLPEVGPEIFDVRAPIRTDFFRGQLKKYLQSDLNVLGKEILEGEY